MLLNTEPIAIVGIGCNFPGNARSPEAFWQLLVEGREAITNVPADRWNGDAFFHREPKRRGKIITRRAGFVDGITRFDAAFFGISSREAFMMDPQQRMLLEVAWESLEDAGIPPDQLAGRAVGVYVGISAHDHGNLVQSHANRHLIDAHSNSGIATSICANRISHQLDLRGPSVAIDTACSSSLTATHLACQSLSSGETEMALAGGVNVLLVPEPGIGFSRATMLSPDGKCRMFDASANGFVRAEGAGLVVLKPLSAALRDGNRVYALIRGTAINEDGRTPTITMPNESAQTALLRAAYQRAGVNPSEVQYVEAHGTGTPVGDPIEARALGTVMGEGRSKDTPLRVGSVKTNIGHLESGSGVAGLIKVALALHHREIPRNLNFKRPNPAIDLKKLKLAVQTEHQPWPFGKRALAGVNSFGFGGANAHAVLEGFSPVKPPSRHAPVRAGSTPWPVLVPISARSPEALKALGSAYAEALEASPGTSLTALGAAAALRRSHHPYRLAALAHSREALCEKLRAFEPGPRALAAGQLAFVFSGQGPQWWAMGRELFQASPLFRSVIERCDAALRPLAHWRLIDELHADERSSRMGRTDIAQPAIFALQVGLAALWKRWGIEPKAVTGHSVGEVAAAHVAGAFTLEEAAFLVFHRSRVQQKAGGGKMLAVTATPGDAEQLLKPYAGRLTLAGLNGPSSVTLAGDAEAIDALAAQLESQKIFCRKLHVACAFHSHHMDPIRDELLAALAPLKPRATVLPFVSTVTGEVLDGQALGAEYWWQNVREPVRFTQAAHTLLNLRSTRFVELGPHPVLSAGVRELASERSATVLVVSSLRRNESDTLSLNTSVGKLYENGETIDWAGFCADEAPAGAELRLPTYPWQREQFSFEADASRARRLAAPAHPLLAERTPVAEPTWQTRLDLRALVRQ